MYCENISYTRSDSKNLEKFLLKESSVPTSKRLCVEHRAKCSACEIINQTDHAAQSQLINNMYNNISTYKLPDGTFQIKHAYLYRNDPAVTYAPENSNIIEASCHSRNTVKRAQQNNSLPLLIDQVDKMIKTKVFVELSNSEILELEHRTHNFTFFNHVFNGNSISTPYRMISNTSSISNLTTISTEMLAPEKVLNSQEAAIIRWRLYGVPLVSDIKRAYHTIEVSELDAYLRLFFWWEDPPECKVARIFKQVRQSFGDPPASAGLELAIEKFVTPSLNLETSKFIVHQSRYADNLTFSVPTIEEYFNIKADLTKAFRLYNMNLKYIISTQEIDPDGFENNDRGKEEIERLLGIDWSVVSDTVSAMPSFSLFERNRGKLTGPLLIDMTDQEILDQPISRIIFLRLTAQAYNRLQDL